MLAMSRLQTIVCTTRIQDAELFYSDTLGLPLKARSHGALVFDVSGSDLRVSPVPSLEPSAHTVVGFSVLSLQDVMSGLAAKGVVWERFPNVPHDESGALTLPDGTQVAWFRDPDGNLLSIVQYR